jgi:hypothetical protein
MAVRPAGVIGYTQLSSAVRCNRIDRRDEWFDASVIVMPSGTT